MVRGSALAAGSGRWDDTLIIFGAMPINPSSGWDRELSLDLTTFLAAPDAAAAVEQIVRAIDGLPIRIRSNGNWTLSLPPVGTDGFPIHLSKSGSSVRVLFGSFEQEFDALEQVLPWVERALSRDYQLRITYLGLKPREFRIEPVGSGLLGSPPVLGEDVLVGGYVILTSSLIKTASTVIKRNSFAPARRRANNPVQEE